MLAATLVRLYPRLYHVAEAGSWRQIFRRGLLSSAQLCDLYDVADPQRHTLLAARRPATSALKHPVHGRAVLRDQGPLSTTKLASCLTDGMTVEQWLLALNGRVFFWLQENRLHRMLKAYDDQDHDVLTVDTAGLVAAHQDRVRLSRINSGSTAYLARPRGPETFQRIEDYPHPARHRAVAAASDVAELCVLDGVPDIAEHVVRVERRHGLAVTSTLLER